MSKHGGSRKGAGRKKGSGLSVKIKKHVDSFMEELLSDKDIMDVALDDLKQMSLSSGWIYVIKDNFSGRIKIGVTQRKNPQRRLSQYRSHKMDISIIFMDWVDYCYEIENDIHSLVSEYRDGDGDWFNLDSNKILSVIEKISRHKHLEYYGR